VTPTACAPGWSRVDAGNAAFAVANRSGHTVEVNLIQVSSQGIAAEIETLGPATTQQLTVALANGGYFWRCLADGVATTNSATVQASGSPAEPGSMTPVALTVKPPRPG
jgi:hypothetical protein